MCELVPIRVELDLESGKLRDCFLWNFDDPKMTAHECASIIVNDYGLSSMFVTRITESIQQQINTHMNVVPFVRSTISNSILTINLSIRVGEIFLRDKFEWDAIDQHITPEEMGNSMVRDLNLPFEFGPLITHSMIEQINDHLKTIAQVSNFNNVITTTTSTTSINNNINNNSGGSIINTIGNINTTTTTTGGGGGTSATTSGVGGSTTTSSTSGVNVGGIVSSNINGVGVVGVSSIVLNNLAIGSDISKRKSKSNQFKKIIRDEEENIEEWEPEIQKLEQHEVEKIDQTLERVQRVRRRNAESFSSKQGFGQTRKTRS